MSSYSGSCTLEKRKKFLPCVVYANQRKNSYNMFVFPNKDVLVNSLRYGESLDRTGYTKKRSLHIDCTDPTTPIYTATLQLIPRGPEQQQQCESSVMYTSEDEENNNRPPAHFVSSITVHVDC